MRRPLAIGGLIVVLLTIIYYHSRTLNIYKDIENLNGKEMCITGKVVDIDIKNDGQVIYLKGVNSKDTEFPKLQDNNKIMCYMKGTADVRIGSSVLIRGTTGVFSHATNEGEFDSRDYYLSIGVYLPMYDCILLSKGEDYNVLDNGLYNIKNYLAGKLNAIFPKEDSGIMEAMLLGRKNEIDPSTKSLYQKSGISHILAISGLHVSILGMFLYGLLRRINCNRYVSLIIPVIIMILYGCMTGFSISTFRAVLMFSILMGAHLVRRTYDLPTALSLAAVVALWGNPYAFMSGSFFLSFVAVFGIAVFSRALIIQNDNMDKKIIGLINSFISCFSVSFYTLPLILYYYYEFPLYSVLINMIILPCMGILLGIGIVALLVSIISINLGIIIGYPCHIILSLFDTVCKISERLPFGHIVIGKPSIKRVLVFYGLTFLIIMTRYIKNEKFKKHISIFKLFIIMLAFIILIPPRKNFKVAMLDVGQGDAICIISKDTVLMVDGGSSSRSQISKYILLPYLKANGVEKIDYWLISHPDADHTSGLIEMLEGDSDISIGGIVLPDTLTIQKDAEDIVTLAGKKQIPISYISRGDKLESDRLEITFINPDKNKSYDDPNSYSEVFILKYDDFKMLFTGDATLESERDYLKYCTENNILLEDVDVLKVPHHGSNTSTGTDLIDRIDVSYAFISCGKNNRYGHPNKEILERIKEFAPDSKLYRTDACGQITVTIDRGRIVYTYIDKKGQVYYN